MHDSKKKKKKKEEEELPIERKIHNLVGFIFSPVRALVYTRGSQKKKNIVRFMSCR